MSEASDAKSSQLKVRRYRQKLRRRGLRPIQIWLSDLRASSFRSQAHHQSLAVATSAVARRDQAFINAVSMLNLDKGGL